MSARVSGVMMAVGLLAAATLARAGEVRVISAGAVKSIVYVDPASGATSGTHFASVLQKLGIAEAVKPKTKLVPGGYPAELVAKGEVELVVHQISEIVPVKGVTLVGPLPKELQKLTIYSAGVAAKSTNAELARGFMAFLTRSEFRAKFAEAGLDYKE